MTSEPLSGPSAKGALERKVLRARLALVFEQVWLRLWIPLAVAGAFVAVSYAGLWSRLGDGLHVVLLLAFAVAMLAALVNMARVPWPTRDAAIRRIERVSGVAHRPASSYEDTLSAPATDPATSALWRAHRERMAALLARLKVGKPRPRTDRFDPFAVRALVLLCVLLGTVFLGPGAMERIRSAFRFSSSVMLAEARLDAWVTPPAYTGRAPVMLADGAAPIGEARADTAGKVPDVPENSVLIVRSAGMGSTRLAIEITPHAETADGKAPRNGDDKPAPVERIEAEIRKDANDVQEVRYELKRAASIRAFGGSTPIVGWSLAVIPDRPPRIGLSKPPELTPRGSLKLTYKVDDDYGVASAEAKVEKLKRKAADPAKDWALPPPPRGPRPPLVRPPELTLRLPQGSAKDGEAHTYLELASHPWAGLKVLMTLEAKDVAGQLGRSPGMEMVLPERRFTKPLARAVIEQRRRLLDDPRYRDTVRTALDALTLEPDGFIDDSRVYLGLRSAYHRLGRDRSRAGMKSVVDQLWHVALRIEDGSLSDAERALREAQEELAKALEDGASDEDIKRLMDQLRQALNDYMKQLAEQSGNENLKSADGGQDEKNQVLGREDLERMMKNIEDMAKNGSREQAQQLLSEMRDLMERLQSGRTDEAQAKKNQEMMKMMDELGDMVGDQQQLMDDTFAERREGRGEDGDNAPPGMKGMGSEEGREGQGASPPGMGQRPQRGRGQPGQQGQQGQGQQGQGRQGRGDQLGQGSPNRPGLDQLRERQRELRDRLGRLQEQMRGKGAASDQLGQATEAMESAEEALEKGDLEGATEQQARALDSMRQGSQQMAKEMMQNMPQRYGQPGNSPRDPLGRPQRSQGPDLGTSVKVPDEIDIQRAREILEELRRRLGDATRRQDEIDYLERLLRRF